MTWKQCRYGYEATRPADLPETVKLSNGLTVPFTKFTDIRGTGGDILYWQYTHVGPGVRKTTYLIWN